jgi:hypothetical protein
MLGSGLKVAQPAGSEPSAENDVYSASAEDSELALNAKMRTTDPSALSLPCDHKALGSSSQRSKERQAAWDADLARRAAALVDGVAHLIPSGEVLKRLWRRIHD